MTYEIRIEGLPEDGLNQELARLQAIAKAPHEHVRPFTRGKFLVRVKTVITKYPPKPRYPLRWKSEKQRRAYFASNGFGKGIPYQRRGDLGNRWRESVFKNVFTFRNTARYASFVIGDDQEPFHNDTGWQEAIRHEPDLVDEFGDLAQADVLAAVRAPIQQKGQLDA